MIIWSCVGVLRRLTWILLACFGLGNHFGQSSEGGSLGKDLSGLFYFVCVSIKFHLSCRYLRNALSRKVYHYFRVSFIFGSMVKYLQRNRLYLNTQNAKDDKKGTADKYNVANGFEGSDQGLNHQLQSWSSADHPESHME